MSECAADAAVWLRFRVGDGTFAIPLSAVAEVTAAETPHLIPLVPLSEGGVLNLRGEPLPVLAGEALFEARDAARGEYLLVLELEQRRLGVAVNEVSRISRVRRSSVLEDSPSGPPFVEWIRFNGETLGLIEPTGLFAAVAALFSTHAAPAAQGDGSCQHGF